MRDSIRLGLALAVLGSVAVALSCSGGGGGGGGGDGDGDGGKIPGASGVYRVFAWNDLGMHCLNPSYDADVILPPYNNLRVQVVRRGNPPEVITDGLTVEYAVVGNTTSYGKGDFAGFWDNMQDLFGVTLPPDEGLNLSDPGVHNGLSGEMIAKGDHFEANGIPVTPIEDDLRWNPYQVAEITVKDAEGTIVAQTRTTIPTSDEIDCAKCHRSASSPDAPEDPYLEIHDEEHGTDLATRSAPFLCASSDCHVSPALGQSAAAGVSYLSGAIHSFHGDLSTEDRPACYDCHPGAETQCNRSLAHATPGGGCEECHGDLAEVGASIAAGRVPWKEEPKCADCHEGATIPEVDTGATLYRDAIGHGGMGCPACHSSPHAMVPSREESDNYQAVQYQKVAVTIGSCVVCHNTSRGGGSGGFQGQHGSPNSRITCNICHTETSGDAAEWPHGYQWKGRTR